MAAQMRIVQNESLADSLKALMDIVKDPKAISAAHETVRKESALTDEHLKKVADAKAFIEQSSKLETEFKAKESNLAKDRAEHTTIVNDFITEKDAEIKRLKDISDALDAAAAEQVEKEKRYLADIKALEVAKEEFQKKIIAENELLVKERNKIATDAAINTANTEKNAQDKKELEAKITKLREAAAI